MMHSEGGSHVKTLLAMCLVVVGLLLGCGDSKTPISPAADNSEIVTTVVIDSCYRLGAMFSSPIDSLCDGTSQVTISPTFVYPDVKSASPSQKSRRRMTGPAHWSFSNPRFRDALLDHLEGRSLRITVSTNLDTGESWFGIFAVFGRAGTYDTTIMLRGPVETSLDSNGYPLLDTIELKGSILTQEYRYSLGFSVATGEIVAEINLSGIPIEIDREPPIVARPYLTPEELRAVPTVLTLGDKTLVFTEAVVAQQWGRGGVGLSFTVTEESLHNVDEGRMDFVWMVSDADLWEPSVPSVWNTSAFSGSASDGTFLPAGTNVDVVVGFVDIGGVVHLIRAATEVQSDY
jgi:hypothetical protein